MALSIVPNLLYLVFLITPLFTSLLTLLKITGNVFNLSISNSSTSNFKRVKPAFLAEFGEGTPTAFLNLPLLHY